MASLPSPTQVAGPHYPTYEAYYQQIDPSNQGTIAPMDAARFLKKSKLSDIVLGKIWELSDPAARGFLNKQGFFVALKLCALAQSGRGISMDNILASDVPQPKMGDIPKIPANKINSAAPVGIDWTVKPSEKAKYDQLFDQLQPLNGVLPGKKVRGVLEESKLPIDILGKIWDLADLDKDGSLSRHEFMIAMHLVYKALDKHAIPNTLPPELLPPGKRKDSVHASQDLIMAAPKPAIPPQPVVPPYTSIPPQPSRPPLPPQPLYGAPPVITQQPSLHGVNSLPPVAPVAPVPASPVWVVTVEEKAKYDSLFASTDADRDGFVSGVEIKDVFLQSGVPQKLLAHIWGLCDTSQTGKLNNEQFALAMWLINRKLKGIEPPAALTPEMVPPSLRNKSHTTQAEPVVQLGPQATPEMELIATEVHELSKERIALESDIAQKEAELKLRDGEVRSLQSELDTLAATLRQLENQKGEAQKRLNDLKAQKDAVELELSDLLTEVEAEHAIVDKLRVQAEEQEESLRNQENELSSKKQELESLKQEEQRLEKLNEDNRKSIDNLAKKLQDSLLEISQVKTKVSELEDTQRRMEEAVDACDAAITANDPSLVADTALSIGPDHRDPEVSRLAAEPEPEKPVSAATATFNGDAAFDSDFSNDAFSNQNGFTSGDAFASAFGEKPAPSGDPFTAFGAPPQKADPFDPFGDGKAAPPPVEEEADPFGCDPFANLHAPERKSAPPTRSESPSPALPPKKAKQPPPRPAPPRPAAPSMRAAPVPPTPSPDPFANSSGFDNFANFDAKFNKPTTTPAAVSPRYESFEFTEDPFKNYRYEDLFNIADPFAADSDKTPSDPFGDSDPAHDPFSATDSADSFEARFPKSSDFDDDLKPDFVNGNVFNGKSKDRNANPLKGNVDPFLAPIKQVKGKNEDAELAWAAQESLRLEGERKRREAQEKADLELAIALSKKENEKGRGLKGFLKLGRQTPTT